MRAAGKTPHAHVPWGASESQYWDPLSRLRRLLEEHGELELGTLQPDENGAPCSQTELAELSITELPCCALLAGPCTRRGALNALTQAHGAQGCRISWKNSAFARKAIVVTSIHQLRAAVHSSMCAVGHDRLPHACSKNSVSPCCAGCFSCWRGKACRRRAPCSLPFQS